jgi:hypothetical protein
MPRRPVIAFGTALAVLGACACSRASDESNAKKWQEPPPPNEVVVPPDLSIAVAIDGAAAPAITSEQLKATKPDFIDPEHRAWKIPTLVPAAAPAGTTVEATSPSGVAVKYLRPTGEGLEPVLYLTRRGELVAAAVDPKNPFPRYHGEGGRMRRPGDSVPRVNPVVKLAVIPARP